MKSCEIDVEGKFIQVAQREDVAAWSTDGPSRVIPGLALFGKDRKCAGSKTTSSAFRPLPVKLAVRLPSYDTVTFPLECGEMEMLNESSV